MENKEHLPFLPISEAALNKTLKTWHIWALAVGLVISGEYFGWNYGFDIAGTFGFLIATGIVTVLYFAFVYSYAELTCMLPHAGGPYAFASKAFGPKWGMIAGYVTLIEFLFATPAIAFALGSYFNFLTGLPANYVAIFFYVFFTVVNIWGINVNAFIASLIAIFAVAELVGYFVVAAPSFDIANLNMNNAHFSLIGVFKSLPFAIWFYLGIEGIAMVSEEVREKKRTFSLSKGYILGFFTLLVIVFCMVILSGGLPNSSQYNKSDHLIPSAISSLLGTNHYASKFFALFGSLGLLASFHAIMISYSRQIRAMAIGRDLPSILGRIHPRHRTPYLALIFGSIVGIISIIACQTDFLIILSVLGAVTMYIITMFSLISLRKNQPNLQRPFKTSRYAPHFAIFLTCICLLAIIVTHVVPSIVFGVIMMIFMLTGRQKTNKKEPNPEFEMMIDEVTIP